MKQTIQLESKDIRKIIALFLGIKEEDVIPNRYSFSVQNVDIEAIKVKMSE